MSQSKIWSEDIELILDNIRKNSVLLSEQHKIEYLKLRHTLNYFRLPIIALSGINSFASVGLSAYITQQYLSGITCLISLTITLISSIELFLSIQNRMENELNMSKEYYLLSIDIYKQLSLNVENRSVDGSIFLDEKMGLYENLFEKSNIIKRRIEDSLTKIETKGILQLTSTLKENNSENSESSL